MVDRLPDKLRRELRRAISISRLRAGGAAVYNEVRDQSVQRRPERIARWNLIVEAARLMERDHLSRWGAAQRVSGKASIAKDVDKKLKEDPQRYHYHARLAEIAALLVTDKDASPGRVLGSAPVKPFFSRLCDRPDIADLMRDKILVDLTYHLLGDETSIASDAPEFTRKVSPDHTVSISTEELISALDQMLAELRVTSVVPEF